jgi:hypothetical protein
MAPTKNGSSNHIFGNADIFGGKAFTVVAYNGAQYYNAGKGDDISHRQFGFGNKLIAVVPLGQTVSGTYYVLARPANPGGNTAWYLNWFVVATAQEVSLGQNLSAEQLYVMGIGI